MVKYIMRGKRHICRRRVIFMAELVFAAFFCFAMVFALLAGLYVLLKVFTVIIGRVEKKLEKEKKEVK